MTTTEKIEQEEELMRNKQDALDLIYLADQQLRSLKRDYKDTESKELEIHLLWESYFKL